MILHGPDRRSWLAPEVIQTSAMDCGPAALKCILEGWRIPVSYPRLREACQTDVDGTSIDTLEEVARLLGLEAEQVMLPLDHVLADEAEALPALAVVRLPAGVTHFVVAWRRHGPLVQVMDPATGRRLVAARRFLEELYLHRMPVAAEVWREWAGSDGAAAVLVARMAELGVGRAEAEALVALAGGDPTWRALAEVDAGVRMAAALVRARGVDRGREARALLHALIARPGKIPDAYWTVRPVSGGEDQLLMGGAVLMRVTGRAAAGASLPPDRRPDLPPDLVAALEEPPARPGREILDLVRADGVLAPAAIGAALVVAAGAVLAEAVLFRAFLDLGREIARPGERLAAIAALLAFSVGLLLVELGAAKGVLRAGRRLETRLRAALLERLPRLFDSYFRSRLTSDMAERGHAMHTLREVPDLGARLVRACADLVCTALGIFWIDPHSAPLALLACAVALGVPLALQPMLTDRDLRLRTHIGALTRSTFDALRGTVPIRTHVAGAAV
ncbi:MAG TPA: cysteine peptidase family C39 domain-containing protein, partial [Kofleriaceae bacterium]|nr:cysteine peptidase family C39 domain-containing protein [Kofleriaceae bacterium]